MIVHFKKQNREFWPSRNGYEKENYGLNLSKAQLAQINREAFSKSYVPVRVMDYIIAKTLASGACSGITCYTLAKFCDENISIGDSQFLIAVFQARTWGRYFLRQALHSYFLSPQRLLLRVCSGLKENKEARPVFLVFLPRVFNLQNITLAHTVLPFWWKEGLENIYLGIYDSNYPGDDERVMVYNKFTHSWSYDGKNNEKWVITINFPENLTRKVPFLI